MDKVDSDGNGQLLLKLDQGTTSPVKGDAANDPAVIKGEEQSDVYNSTFNEGPAASDQQLKGPGAVTARLTS